METVSKICKVLRLFFTIWFIALIADAILADYSYSRQVESFWNLSVKASTIQKKSAYLDQYVAALEAVRMADSSALWLKTPDNSVEQNKLALYSLQDRMHEILTMNVSSFEYQQAMAQITGQEQDEAHKMLSVFKDAWYLEHHFFLWDWMGVLSFVVLLTAVIITGLIGWTWTD